MKKQFSYNLELKVDIVYLRSDSTFVQSDKKSTLSWNASCVIIS